MKLFIGPSGQVTCAYEELIDLAALGNCRIVRASHVEPDSTGRWRADLSPVGGPVLGPFCQRSQALAAERAWLGEWLARGSTGSCRG